VHVWSLMAPRTCLLEITSTSTLARTFRVLCSHHILCLRSGNLLCFGFTAATCRAAADANVNSAGAVAAVKTKSLEEQLTQLNQKACLPQMPLL
jgi:hypothetical protein